MSCTGHFQALIVNDSCLHSPTFETQDNVLEPEKHIGQIDVGCGHSDTGQTDRR